MLSPQDLEAIRSRAESATKGPDEDADFRHHARTDVPALLDEVERLHGVGAELVGSTLGWKERASRAESTIAEVRKSLNEAFDDIGLDDDGQPEELDTMAWLAGNRVKSAQQHAASETARADKAEHRISQLRSRVNLEMAMAATPDPSPEETRVTELEQHSAILLQLIDRGFTDAPGMDTATEEMIADSVVPKGWSIYDVKPVAKETL